MPTPVSPVYFLRITQLAAYLAISKSSIWSKLNPQSPYFDSSFPQPIKIGSATCFVQSEVDAYIAECINASRNNNTLAVTKNFSMSRK
jgi:prophage regulatory protein